MAKNEVEILVDKTKCYTNSSIVSETQELANRINTTDERLTKYIELVKYDLTLLNNRLDELENRQTLGYIISNTIKKYIRKYKESRIKRLKSKIACYKDDGYYK